VSYQHKITDGIHCYTVTDGEADTKDVAWAEIRSVHIPQLDPGHAVAAERFGAAAVGFGQASTLVRSCDRSIRAIPRWLIWQSTSPVFEDHESSKMRIWLPGCFSFLDYSWPSNPRLTLETWLSHVVTSQDQIIMSFPSTLETAPRQIFENSMTDATGLQTPNGWLIRWSLKPQNLPHIEKSSPTFHGFLIPVSSLIPGYSWPLFLGTSGESWALTAVEDLQHLLSFLHPERLQEDASAFSRGEAIVLINGDSRQKNGIFFGIDKVN